MIERSITRDAGGIMKYRNVVIVGAADFQDMRGIRIFDDNGKVVSRGQVRTNGEIQEHIYAADYKRTGDWQDHIDPVTGEEYWLERIAPVAPVGWFSRACTGFVAVVAAALSLAVYVWLASRG